MCVIQDTIVQCHVLFKYIGGINDRFASQESNVAGAIDGSGRR